jgi:hypothetical protein
MITQLLNLTLGAECASLQVCDHSTFQAPTSKQDVVSRNLSLLEGCDTLLATSAKAQKICWVLEDFVAGDTVLVIVAGVAIQYSVAIQDVVLAGGDITALQASELTGRNVAAKIAALFVGRLTDAHVDVRACQGCDDCYLIAESTLPGVPFLYSASVVGTGTITPTVEQVNVANFNYTKAWTWDFTGLATPLILSSLSANGSNVLVTPLVGSGATLALQLVDLASKLNQLALGLGTFYGNGSKLQVVSTTALGAISGTANASSITRVPAAVLQSGPDCFTHEVSRDALYRAVLTHEVLTPTEYYATLQFDQTVTMTGSTVLTFASHPLLPLGFVVQYSAIIAALPAGSYAARQSLLLDTIVGLYNANIAAATPAAVGLVYAKRVGNQIQFNVTSSWLSVIGQTATSVGPYSLVITAPGATLLAGTQPAYDVLTPRPGTTKIFSKTFYFANLCRAYCGYGQILAREAASQRPQDASLPLSTEIQLLMDAINHALCGSDVDCCAVTAMIERLTHLTAAQGCTSC